MIPTSTYCWSWDIAPSTFNFMASCGGGSLWHHFLILLIGSLLMSLKVFYIDATWLITLSIVNCQVFIFKHHLISSKPITPCKKKNIEKKRKSPRSFLLPLSLICLATSTKSWLGSVLFNASHVWFSSPSGLGSVIQSMYYILHCIGAKLAIVFIQGFPSLLQIRFCR